MSRTTNALTLEPKTKFKNWHDRKPIKELDDRGHKMVESMTFGVDEAETLRTRRGRLSAPCP